MDPQATLEIIRNINDFYESEEVLQAVRDLLEWIDGGGFTPVPWNHHTWDMILDRYNKAAGNHGVEAVHNHTDDDPFYQDIVMLYSNTGDPYQETLCFRTDTYTLRLCGWGDMVESMRADGVEIP